MQNIRAILSGANNAGSKSEQLLVKLCTDIAEAYLKTKIKKHSLLLNLANSSLRDFAIDCIAELFEHRNQELIVFEKWLPVEELDKLTDGELFIKLRRLVFSRVNDHIYNSYRSYDPSLGKIIRNIKRGIKSGSVEGLVISENGQYIVLEEGSRDGLEMPVELFSMKFSARFKNPSHITDILENLRAIFESLEEYKCSIDITALALIIREHYTAIQDEETPQHIDFGVYLNEETEAIISNRVEQTKKDLYVTYVVKNKLSDSEFSAYFMVVYNILLSYFKENKDMGKSYFEHFNEVFKNTSKDAYRAKHRKFLEYFAKKARKNLELFLKTENNSANRLIG